MSRLDRRKTAARLEGTRTALRSRTFRTPWLMQPHRARQGYSEQASSPARKMRAQHLPALQKNADRLAKTTQAEMQGLWQGENSRKRCRWVTRLILLDSPMGPREAQTQRTHWPCEPMCPDRAAGQEDFQATARRRVPSADCSGSPAGRRHLYSWYCPTSTSSSAAIASSASTALEQ
jgi:hypothetical protein